MILIPLFMYVIYPVIAKFVNFTSERKMAVGMVFLLIQCWYLSVTQKSIDEHTTYVLPEYMYEGQALGNFSGNTFAFNIYCNNEVKPCPEMKQKGTHEFHPYDDEEYNNLMGYDEQEARKREHYQTYLPNGPKATKTSVRYWSSDCPKEGCMLQKEQDTTGDAKAGLVFDHGTKGNTIEINMKRGNLNKIFRLDGHWFTTYPTLIKYEQFLGRNTLTAYKLGEIKDEYICENVDELSNWYRGIVWKNTTEVSSKVREALGLSTLNVKRMNYTEATITDGSYKPAFFEYQVATEEMETNGIVERLTDEKLTSGLHVRTYIVAPDLKCGFKDSQVAHKFGVQGRYSLMIESSSEGK